MSGPLDFLQQLQLMPDLTLDDVGAPVRDKTLWLDINQGKPSGPQRLTARQQLRVLQAQSGAAPQVVQVHEVNRACDCIPIPFSLGVAGIGGGQLILSANSKERTFLSIRNSIASAGNLFVGLNNIGDDTNASYAIPAGGILILDTGVPQNDIWLSCDGAITTGTLTYALGNWGL